MMHAKTRDSQKKHQTGNHSSNFNGSFVSVGNNSGPYHLLSQQPSQIVNDQIHMFNSNNQPIDYNSMKKHQALNSDPLTIQNRDLSVYTSSQHNPSQQQLQYQNVNEVDQLSPSKMLLGGQVISNS